MLDANDSWVVLGPGRAGSQVITSVVQDAYKEQGILLTRANPLDPLAMLKPATIHHSHDPLILNYLSEHTQVVISTRDLHDTACSRIIMDRVGRVHFNQFLPMDMSIHRHLSASTDSFYIEPNEYRQVIKDLLRVYDQLVDLPYTYIDYREFAHDSRLVRNRLYLPAPTHNPRPFLATLRTPRTHGEWISNYDELANLGMILCPWKPWTSIPTPFEARHST